MIEVDFPDRRLPMNAIVGLSGTFSGIQAHSRIGPAIVGIGLPLFRTTHAFCEPSGVSLWGFCCDSSMGAFFCRVVLGTSPLGSLSITGDDWFDGCLAREMFCQSPVEQNRAMVPKGSVRDRVWEYGTCSVSCSLHAQLTVLARLGFWKGCGSVCGDQSHQVCRLSGCLQGPVMFHCLQVPSCAWFWNNSDDILVHHAWVEQPPSKQTHAQERD